MFKKSKIRVIQNVEFSVIDKNGKPQKLFGEFFVFNWLRKRLGINFPQIFPFGIWREKIKYSNLITNAGLAGIASRINGAGGENAFTYIALGTGTNPASASDTALQSEITSGGLQRVNATATRVTTDVTNDTAQLQHTFTATSDFAVTESGVFNASSGGTMLARQVFSVINVSAGSNLQVTWRFDVD